jgi:hypothetical protein
MTDDRTLERAARSWLEEGPTRAPDRAVDAALSRIQTTRQERDLRIPWRLPTMNRYLLPMAAALIVAIGAVYLITRPASNIGPPATATPAAPPSGPASIEGTWDVSYTRQEMLAAGIADQGEDNPGNYGHFHLTFKAGLWRMDQLSPTTLVGGLATYSIAGDVARLYSPNDDITFAIPYTVTATTLTFGRGGPVGFRVKPWSRVATEPMATDVPGSPLGTGSFDGPVLQVADLVAAMNANADLTAADRTAILDEIWAIRDKSTFQVSIYLLGGQYVEREIIDGSALVGSSGRYTFPNGSTVVFTERINGADVTTTYELTVDGESFSLHRIAQSWETNPLEDFVVGTLFESGPFVLR